MNKMFTCLLVFLYLYDEDTVSLKLSYFKHERFVVFFAFYYRMMSMIFYGLRKLFQLFSVVNLPFDLLCVVMISKSKSGIKIH